MNGRTLTEIAVCLDLEADEIARLALWFTTGEDEASHNLAARKLMLDAAADTRRPAVRTRLLDAIETLNGGDE